MKSICFTCIWLSIAFTGDSRTAEAAQGTAQYLHNDSGIRSLQSVYGRKFDIRFLSQSIEHHRGSIALAHGGLQTNLSLEVKTFAQEIIKRDEHEIRLLKGFLKAKYNTAPLVSEALLVRTDMAQRMKQPTGLGRQFIGQMVGHEQEEVQMGQLVGKHSKSKALIELAARMVKHSRTDIQLLVNFSGKQLR